MMYMIESKQKTIIMIIEHMAFMIFIEEKNKLCQPKSKSIIKKT